MKLHHLKPQTLKHVEIIKVLDNIHVIYHWKAVDLEVTDFEYRRDQTDTSAITLSETSNPKTGRDYKSFR